MTTAEKKSKCEADTHITLEEIEDMFQIEIVEGEQVYACNICDEGFDKEAEIRQDIVEDHKEIIPHISEKSRIQETMNLSTDADHRTDTFFLGRGMVKKKKVTRDM